MQSWTVVGTSVAATEQTITKAAVTGRTHFVTGFTVSVITADVTGDCSIILKDGTTAKYTTYFGDSDVRGAERWREFVHPIKMTQGTAANLVIASAGSLAVTVGSMKGYTV